jgi:hypothetical protein
MRRSFGAFDKVRKLQDTLPDVEEGTMYGAPAFKTKGKMFACMATNRSSEPGTLVVRVPFAERDRLIRANPGTFYVRPHYVGYPCVLVRLDRISQPALRGLLHLGWRFVRSKDKRSS